MSDDVRSPKILAVSWGRMCLEGRNSIIRAQPSNRQKATRSMMGDDGFRRRRLSRPYVTFYSGIAGADLRFCRLIRPGGDLRSWLCWLRCVEAERDGLAEQVEYAARFRGRC